MDFDPKSVILGAAVATGVMVVLSGNNNNNAPSNNANNKNTPTTTPTPTTTTETYGKVPVGTPCDTFDATKMGPADPILGVTLAFRADQDPNKIDGGVGAYRTEEGQPLVLEVVKIAEKRVLNELENGKRNLEYLGQAGDETFTKATRSFLFGSNSKSLQENRICTVQALSGTGGLRLGGEFLRRHRPCKIVMPNPTWGNHFNIFESSGLPTGEYRYFDKKTLGLDLIGMLEDLRKLKQGTAVLLHVCAHNPTGVDPTKEQWQQIMSVMKEQKLLPFFDSAYQGFASGDVDEDAYPVRLFESNGFEMLVSQSYSKNMGLYGERVGALSIVCPSEDASKRVMSQMMIVIRANYSNPPKHGAAICATILQDPVLLAQWKKELKSMVDRIAAVRKGLRAECERVGAPGTWDFMTKQIGMFTYTALTPDMCSKLAKEHHIYITSNGRISLAGLKQNQLSYIATAIKNVMTAKL
jgi:aspartate aminotransferase